MHGKLHFTMHGKIGMAVPILRYNIRMMGISIDEPLLVFGNNQSLLTNTSLLHSTLNNNSSNTDFQFVCGGI